MTATSNSRSGDLLAAIRLDLIDPNDDRVGDEPAREPTKQPPEWLPTPPAGSVVPFARRRLGDPRKRPATFFVLGPDQRPAPRTGTRERRMRIVAYLALSFVVHGGIYAVLWEKPKPLASIGVEAIAVEIVVGAPAGMGIAAAASENEVRAAAP